MTHETERLGLNTATGDWTLHKQCI